MPKEIYMINKCTKCNYLKLITIFSGINCNTGEHVDIKECPQCHTIVESVQYDASIYL